MDCQKAPEGPTFTRTEKVLMLVIFAIVIVVAGVSMTSCQQLGIAPIDDIDDQFTVGIQCHKLEPKPCK